MSAIEYLNNNNSCPLSVKLGYYPSGEPLISEPIGAVSRVLIRPNDAAQLMAGLWFLDALAERGKRPAELIIPFVPGARQDRLNSSGDYLFTAKSVAREINLRNIDCVTILDPHSDVIAALIDRCNVVKAADCWSSGSHSDSGYVAVVSPDAGAEKRAAAIAKLKNLPLLHAWKTRDISTGEIAGFGMEPTEAYTGGHVLVVDDICDGGGTFIGLSNILTQRLIKADLYVTHGIFSKGTDALLKRYHRIYTTDSIENNNRHGVDLIQVCKKLLEGTV